MLRLLVLVLLLANAGYFAWSQGLLAQFGSAPAQQSEPQRVAQQIRPESIRVLGNDETRRLETSAAGAPRPPECLQAGLFQDGELPALRQALDGWPASSWSIDPAVDPARWLIYMGKYANADTLNRKKAELRQLGISFEPVPSGALEPGISLGSFPTEAAARQQLDGLARQGVHTAKVLQEKPETRGQSLRLPLVDDTLRPRLDDLKVALGSRSLRPCR